jgi:hypothetical protein
MREICLYGSEGGEAGTNQPLLPLSRRWQTQAVIEAPERGHPPQLRSEADNPAPAHADFHTSKMTEAELDTLLQESIDDSRPERKSAPAKSA